MSGRTHGFTLVELMVVVAIAAVVTTVGFIAGRAGKANANLRSSVFELAIRLTGQRSTALDEQQDRVVVIVDAPDNDASKCSITSEAGCARYFVLAPDAGWLLSGFDPSSPATKAAVLEQQPMPRHVRLRLSAAGSHPAAPFDAVNALDTELVTTCGTNQACFAIRFTSDGTVEPIAPDGSAVEKPGLAAVFTGDETQDGNVTALGGDKGILIGFPTGIVRTYPF